MIELLDNVVPEKLLDDHEKLICVFRFQKEVFYISDLGGIHLCSRKCVGKIKGRKSLYVDYFDNGAIPDTFTPEEQELGRAYLAWKEDYGHLKRLQQGAKIAAIVERKR